MSEKELVAAENASADMAVSSSANLMLMLDRGVQAGMDPSALEKLMAMAERVMDREAKVAFSRAMAAFQAECPVITPDGQNKHIGNRYATLERLASVIRPPLAKHGLSYTFDSEHDSETGRVTALCTVHHRDGYSQTARFSNIVEKSSKGMNATQADASGLKYAQRGALRLAFGLQTTGRDDFDDDGHAAGGPAYINEHQVADIELALEEVGADVAVFCDWLGVESIALMPQSKVAQALQGIDAKRRRAAAPTPVDVDAGAP